MWMIIVPLIGGLIVAHIKPKQVSKLPIDGIILFSLILLLTVMGARLGVDPDVMGELGTLGINALLLAIFTIAGSVLALMLLNKPMAPSKALIPSWGAAAACADLP